MPHDPAAFDKVTLFRIWGGEYVPCVLTGMQANDWHHIYGRGGVNLTNDKRKKFSSVFNAAPLSRIPHDRCPILNTKHLRLALFEHTKKIVQNAINMGDYEMTDIDREFLAEVATLND